MCGEVVCTNVSMRMSPRTGKSSIGHSDLSIPLRVSRDSAGRSVFFFAPPVQGAVCRPPLELTKGNARKKNPLAQWKVGVEVQRKIFPHKTLTIPLLQKFSLEIFVTASLNCEGLR